MPKNSKIVVGIDPGTVVMGMGIIKISGSGTSLVLMDTLKLSSRIDAHRRLKMIFEKVSSILLEYKPDEFAIEAPFYGKNVQSMLKLGRAQGVAIAAAMQAGIPVSEYSPRKVKQSVTGNGNADKMQVYKMLQRILNFKEVPESLDATDALAVAICHYFQGQATSSSEKGHNNWKEFLRKNPDRVR